MGGYNQSARPQSTTGQLNVTPLRPWDIQSAQPELIAKGVESGAQSLASGVMTGLKARYNKDNFEAPKTSGIEVSTPSISQQENMTEDKNQSWWDNLFHLNRNTQINR